MSYVAFLYKSNLIEKSIDAGLIMQKSLVAKKIDNENEDLALPMQKVVRSSVLICSMLSFAIVLCYLNFVN